MYCVHSVQSSHEDTVYIPYSRLMKTHNVHVLYVYIGLEYTLYSVHCIVYNTKLKLKGIST